jgi:hypothetical protein
VACALPTSNPEALYNFANGTQNQGKDEIGAQV